MGLLTRRLLETSAMLMLGDALLALIAPKGHVSLWARGPAWWRRTISPFVDHPDRTRAVGYAELLAGVALALAVEPHRAGARARVASEESLRAS